MVTFNFQSQALERGAVKKIETVSCTVLHAVPFFLLVSKVIDLISLPSSKSTFSLLLERNV